MPISDRDARLIQRRIEGRTVAELVFEFGLSRSGVERILYRAGVTVKDMLPVVIAARAAKRAEALKLVDRDAPVQRIVPAGSAPAPKTSAVRSVFELGDRP